MSAAIQVLEASASADLFEAIDRLLAEAAPELLGPGEALEPSRERAFEAEVDAARVLLYASLEGAVVGFVDARLDHPEPGDITVAQLVVAAGRRQRGTGRALVAAVLERAQDRVEHGRLVAGVHRSSLGARAFWSRLGLEAEPAARSEAVLTLSADARALRRT